MWETYDFNYLKHFITHNRDTYCNHHFCHFRLLGMEPSQFLSHAHGNCWHSETTAALFLKRFSQRNRPSNPISNLVCFTHTPEKKRTHCLVPDLSIHLEGPYWILLAVSYYYYVLLLSYYRKGISRVPHCDIGGTATTLLRQTRDRSIYIYNKLYRTFGRMNGFFPPFLLAILVFTRVLAQRPFPLYLKRCRVFRVQQMRAGTTSRRRQLGKFHCTSNMHKMRLATCLGA